MSRPWTSTTVADRCRVVVDNAEFLADECGDAGLDDDGDHLRAGAARLALLLQESARRDEAVRAAVDVRKHRMAQLRRVAHRLNLEIELRLPFAESIELSTAAHLALESSTRFRLERLGPEQRSVLGVVVDEVSVALAAREDAERDCFSAYAAAHAARGRVVAVAHGLRADCERVKAHLLAVLPPDDAAYARVSRRVLRTRRPDAWMARHLTT